MGYEHRFYIVRKTDQYDNRLDKYWAKVKFIFNLGKVYELEDLDKHYPATKHFIYNDICDEILEDEYGKPLTEIPIDELRIILAELARKEYCNPNILVLLGALRQLDQNIIEYEDFVCLHYGC